MNQNSYNRTDAGQKFANEALTKVIVYFLDGNTRTFHSRDKYQSHSLPSREVGISRLKKMVYGWKSKIKKAFIYDLETGEELFKFQDGYWR